MSTKKKQPSYTARELEEETGFDRRTIAYYVQEGLLPRVGRRGPRTRYPRMVRDRLLFIRRVREAEEAGEVPAVSLSDMRSVFERVPASLIARVADGEIAVTPESVQRGSTAFRLPGVRQAMLEERVMGRRGREDEARFREPVASSPPPARPVYEEPVPAATDLDIMRDAGTGEPVEWEDADEDLGEFLRALQDRARERVVRSRSSMDTWTRIEITPEMELSVRGITDEDSGLVERVRWAIRRLLGARGAE
ncbi:MAG: MerR family transcriptional regulator [Gemmatimonadota bacterium]|nr:MerR family transcriptional regulator [Gemmatimonadota bacterium]